MLSSVKNIVTSFAIILTAGICISATCNKQAQVLDLQEGSLQEGVFQDISVEEAFALIQNNAGNPNFIILDVRTQAEFDDGHIENAVNIDYYAADFRDQIGALDKEKTYLVYCRSGNRSRQTMNIMRDLGFTTVYNMLGGINDWMDAGYPVV